MGDNLQPVEERPCGEARYGSHPNHRYMRGRVVYQCPGGAWRPGSVAGASCPLRALRKPHDAHNWLLADSLPAAPCPGYAEPDDGAKEPAPPQSDAQRIRDLEYVIQRAREALGTDMVLVGCDEHTARIAALETALRDVLGKFVHPGHPGEPCKQTGWISLRTIDQWHAVLRGEAT